MIEQWDLYDENRQPLNRTITRGEQKQPGEYHTVVEVWTVNSSGEILVTLRDPHKLDYPDKWENTGGSVIAGESSRQGAIRELREETGIIADENELILLGTYKEESAFVDIYLFKCDIPIEDIVLQEGETVDAKWITRMTLDEMIADLSLALPTGIRFNHVCKEFKRMQSMSEEAKTGWERENRQHFDKIVRDYDKVRWEYPAELYADVFDYVSANKSKKALEIGAGTGKATTPFLKAGYDVAAVEIGENMAAFLIDKFKGERLKVINTSFEDAELEENSYDVIYAASAFHWVDAEIGCPKVFRLLKNGGTFALFRNNAVQADGNELYDGIQAIYDKHYYNHYKPDNRPVRISKMMYEDFLKPAEIYRGFRFESLEQYGFKDITMKLYEATRAYGADDYIALLETMSDHIALPNDNRAALYGGIRDAILKHGGHLQMNYIFQLYMGRKADE